ncbi:Na(+)/H(+) exchange regulatory cofactor-like protein nrfl-1 isoform X2 [Rhipicephalus sanguineus]|uniref:Na(+)/H(+) exchange regulatory cofactor-like protein nrfl-1 isoform X2 n=1 Tax=Rhipicephalus sanguineus TaxID=34632 RepID=UPI0020C20339|nr:Na(+)/H(+) exchange regulatory cofactor-like protein nrfl-1 isoform X2 [Rhipicephalus sanguineus]
MSAVALSPDAPAIRLCHVVKWPDYEGFGFNLHSEKSKPGQYLGKIDEGSPAQLAGLREGDRIVEVNGINISNENHKQVVERIKAVPNETKLLVVDPLADAWYKEHKIIIKSSLPTVKQCHNPVPRPGKRNSGASLGSSSSSSADQPQRGAPSPPAVAPPSKVVSLPAGAPAARLCHLVRRSDFDGYGFNLHADKQRKLQYVGAVDPGSPAEAAGLRANDTIVEVNGVNVEGTNHRDIVERIKSVPNETRLLVVDDGTAAWYREHGIAIRGDLPNVIQLSSVKAAARRSSKPAAVAQEVAAVPHSNVQETAPAPVVHDGLRLCHLSKWPNFDGYGFNLHADKKRQGHFIGQVDLGSPAELGGLRKNDKLLEVNGLSVEGESHREIIERIKQDPMQVELLVIDREGEEAFAKRKQKPCSQSESVVRRRTPAQQPGTEQQQQQQDDLSKSSTPLLTPSPQSTPPQAPERASSHVTHSREEDDTSSVEVIAASPTPTSEEEGDDRSTPRLETPVSDKGSSAVNGGGGGSRSSELRSSTSSSPRDSPVFGRDQKSSVVESTTTTTVIKTSTITTGADRTDGSGSYDVQKAYDVQINNSEVRRISDLQQRGGAVLGPPPPQPAARQAAPVHVENSNGTSQNGAAATFRNGGSLPPPGPDGLNLTMKASELRELLRSRKKKDPRETQMDLRQKYKIIEQM